MIRPSAAKALALVLCASFALPLTACHMKKNYKGEVDKFVENVGSTLSGSKYVFNSAEDASETFFDTRDLTEVRPVKDWNTGDHRSQYFKDKGPKEGFFFKGDYAKLWDAYEESVKNGEVIYDLDGDLQNEYFKNPKNPTVEHLIGLLEYCGFGMAIRAVELMRMYTPDDAVYYSNCSPYKESQSKYIGMRVIFKSEADAKNYWSQFYDMDEAYRRSQFDYDTAKDPKIREAHKKRLMAYHKMDKENYEYDEGKNEGHMTLYLGYDPMDYATQRSIDATAESPDYSYGSVFNVLFSIRVAGKEVTMLCCHIRNQEHSEKEFSDLFSSLDLPDPQKTQLHGLKLNATGEEKKAEHENRDILTDFFMRYSTVYHNAPMTGTGICRWDRTSPLILPYLCYVKRAAWIPFVYDDPEEYANTITG
ncbi:MAG: hypothetical protein IKH92_07195 [Clostridiales bacterium]|nr:hypothetical protein [Clostridiales bacterium]